jgi:hypothetical protein
MSEETPKENGEKSALTDFKDPKTGQFLPGNPGGPGRPQGSVSIITKIKQIFEEQPEFFDSYVAEVLADPKLRAEIIRQIDGSPKQNVDVTSDGKALTVNVVSYTPDGGNDPA